MIDKSPTIFGLAMSDSIPLYVNDSSLKEFYAKVVRAGPKFVVLDKTAFYPEGGGQPTDTGVLKAGDETYKVIKVMKRGPQIFHYLDDNIALGTEVHGVIDWERRLNHMRLHSGEHLLTGLLEAEGSGPKVFSSFSQLDFKPSELTEEIISKVWKQFDEIIDEDVPIVIYTTSRDELDVGDDARKRSFLEKMPGTVNELRMVRIGDYAETFCLGTHVKTTGEIGKLKDLRMESKKKRKKIVYFEL
ncbi:MAG: alanyl-tRNA editing protein [Candidatus Bathyarchaeota archaeon]|nr:alanyl-tRNA editing protein [Candidatus Bathyarchaeota archaeon]